MRFDNQLMAPVALALLTALVVSFLMTPVVKSFAYKVGAIDVPKDERRMHHKPIPRLGGLAIFTGFMASILLFVDIRLNPQMQSILLGAVIIVVLGVVDDIMALPAKLKFVIQIAAALIPVLNGVSIQALSNPNIFSPNAYWVLNWLSVPVTVLWIVGITNAVNLIDGLDGLANGVSAISAATVLVIALICSEAQVAVVMAALVGACVGFLPYNLNPAKMFMGDTGATFLGFILSTMSIQGLFKFYAVISFAVPFLILGLPIFDTAFAMIRRMAHGQSPMHADRGHIHHRLIDMGLNQKQAVATLYVISGILGLSAADYPDLPEVEDEYAVSMQQKVLRSMIEEVAFAVSTNESRPVHTGALFEIADMSLSMVAVDGFRLAFRREKLEKLEGGAFSFVCPGSALSEVKSICGDTEDLVTVTLGKRHILFEIGDTQLICRRLEGEFLDYKNAIPRKNPIQIVAETKALIESIDRVSVVISDKLKSPVRCLFDHDKVMLSAKTGNGEAKDVCRVSGDGDKLEIGFNNRYLMEALRYAPADKVKIELNTGVSPAIIVPVEGEENFLYMVLPVRLKSAE